MRDAMVPTTLLSEHKNACAALQPLKTCSGQLIFHAISSTPCDSREEKVLKYQLLNLSNDSSFLAHVGDTQSPKTTKCR